MTVAHTSRIRIEKHQGPHRTAHIENFEEPLNFGIHGGIKDFYQDKYGREITGTEYPATLDHIIGGVAGWLTGTLGAALDVREVKSADNLVADVEGDIEDVDGVLKITKIRLRYRFKIPPGTRDKVNRALETYAENCPAYVSVKGCIECSWEADIEEEWRGVAAVATFHLVRPDDFDDTLKIAAMLLQDKQDLTYKAVGWMLRQVGRKETGVEARFLGDRASNMPRTMLRYAIEKSPERKHPMYLDACASRKKWWLW